MSSPLDLYHAALNRGDLHADDGQARIMAALDAIFQTLKTKPNRTLFAKLTKRKNNPVSGLYIYGGVGRGKTMLMDLFVTAFKSQEIKRLHFHDFMTMAHDEMNLARKAGADEPVIKAAQTLARDISVLCFDEMEVRDIADAMILKRLFDALFATGITVIATSNRHPDELYKNGLHRDRFLPFIEALKTKCVVMEIEEGQDWRQRLLAEEPRWLVPASASTTAQMRRFFDRLTQADQTDEVVIKVAGREISFAQCKGNIAFVSFDELCAIPLAARDYIAIADRFTGLFITDIPELDDAKQNEARRFMWLVDALYDRGRFLVASAASEMEALYTGQQWGFEFDRTLSRLSEMTRLAKAIED